MPILMTFLMRLPVWPFHLPLRTRLEKAGHLVEHGMDLGHHIFSVHEMVASLGARRATCSTARFSVTLIFSPLNIAAIRPLKSDSSAS